MRDFKTSLRHAGLVYSPGPSIAVKPKADPIANQLALKRHERPPKNYWQDFLGEFHQRQSKPSVDESGEVCRGERLNHWFDEPGPSKWTYAAGLAYAVATIAFFLAPRPVATENIPMPPVDFQIVPVPAPVPTPRVTEQLQEPHRHPATPAPPFR